MTRDHDTVAWRLAAALGDQATVRRGVPPLELPEFTEDSWRGYPSDLKSLARMDASKELIPVFVAWGLDCAARAARIVQQSRPDAAVIVEDALAAGRFCLRPDLTGKRDLAAAADKSFLAGLAADGAAGSLESELGADAPATLACLAAYEAASAAGHYAEFRSGEHLWRRAVSSAVTAAFCSWRASGAPEIEWQRRRLCQLLTE